MAISQTEVIGFCDEFKQFLEENEIDLKAKGLDVASWITDTDTLKDNAVVELTKQDNLKRESEAQTKKAQGAVKTAYDTTSSRLDAVKGVLGKNTPLAKQAGNLRTKIIKQYDKIKAEEPQS